MLDLGHRDRDAVLIFYAWTSIISLAFLLMYIGTSEDWPGEYLIGAVFGGIGIVACLIVTLKPSRAADRAERSVPLTESLEPR
jgi:UDP-GlcNAc:undecaprenyl-phosphate GlcNAc-1-phosphate transferase